MSDFDRLEPLVRGFATGNGSVFVGAGLSVGAGMPGWDALVAPLAREIVGGAPPCASAPDVAQYWVNDHSEQALLDRLVEMLDRPAIGPTVVHRQLAALAAIADIATFFTTNFDPLIERAFREQSMRVVRIWLDVQLGRIDRRVPSVVKLHGDLEDAESLVLTSAQFENFEHTRPRLTQYFVHALQSTTVLFLGYSFADHDLRTLLTAARRNGGAIARRQYALQVRPSQVARRELERRGIEAIPIDGPDPTARLARWLEEFAARVREHPEYRQSARAQASNNNLPRRDSQSAARGFPGRDGLRWRDGEIRDLFDALAKHRLVVLYGLPGIGKSSLALEVGHACASGAPGAPPFESVVWISASNEPERTTWLDEVLGAVARSLGVMLAGGSDGAAVSHAQDRARVANLLAEHRVLVVLDNFETMQDAALTEWLRALPAPGRALLTSRDADVLDGARRVPLHGLSIENALALAREQTAGGRAPSARADDPALAALAKRLAGHPLALHWALGRVKLGEATLEELLSDPAADGSVVGMEATLRGLFERSWQLLGTSGQQIMLASVLFVGAPSFGVDALRAASGLDADPSAFDEGIARCVALTLLELEPAGGAGRTPAEDAAPRYTMHPLARADARRRLDDDPAFEHAARARLAAHFMAYVRAHVVDTRHASPPYWNALVGDGMARVDLEWPSVRALLEWAAAHDRHVLIELVMLLVHYMDSRRLNEERLRFAGRAADALADLQRFEDEALLRIDALAWTLIEERQFEQALRSIAAGLDLIRRHPVPMAGDLRALGLTWQARVHIEQASAADAPSAHEATRLIDEALRADVSPWIACRVRMTAGDVAMKRGRPRDALNLYLQARAYVESRASADGSDDEGHGYQIAPRIGLAYLRLDRTNEAAREFDSIGQAEEIGWLSAEYGRAMVQFRRGDRDAARRRIDELRATLDRRPASGLLLDMIERAREELGDGASAPREA